MDFYVKDYELITDISVLFEKKIVIYGAGFQGRRTAELLDDICVSFECFCDSDENKKEYLGHQVITIDQLKQKTDDEDCLVIVASIAYCEEIVAKLQENRINAYTCSWYGVEKGIENNIEDERLPLEFAKEFIWRKDLWIKTRSIGVQERASYALYGVCSNPDTVMIYQPGKVGSNTLLETLRKEQIAVCHIHRLRSTGMIGKETEIIETAWTDLIQMLRKRKRPLKMIVSVREPLSRALALFFQWFGMDFQRYNMEDIYEFIEEQIDSDDEFTQWFENQLKAVTGIDVYAYPFDKKQGYAWIKEDGIEILLLKMEQMNENQEVIGAFVGKPGLKLVNANVGSSKPYRYIYERIKNEIRFSDELIKKAYGSERYKHFYTEEETENFVKKWIKE